MTDMPLPAKSRSSSRARSSAGSGRAAGPAQPTAMQEAFLRLDAGEVLLGGGAGGGKSIAMLMCALQHTDVPGYNALLLRTSIAELELAGALIERSRGASREQQSPVVGRHTHLDVPRPRANRKAEEPRSPSATSPTLAMSCPLYSAPATSTSALTS